MGRGIGCRTRRNIKISGAEQTASSGVERISAGIEVLPRSAEGADPRKSLLSKMSPFQLVRPYITRIDEVYHVGRLDPAKKSRNSQEANCLSVSLDPEAWQSITPLDGDIYTLRKPDALFLDFHAFHRNKKRMAVVLDWALAAGYLSEGTQYAFGYYDDEAEETRTLCTASRQAAAN